MEGSVALRPGAAVGVVVASEGYPDAPVTGRGVDGAEPAVGRPTTATLLCFHAGTRRTRRRSVRATGGRVRDHGRARCDSLEAAREAAYRRRRRGRARGRPLPHRHRARASYMSTIGRSSAKRPGERGTCRAELGRHLERRGLEDVEAAERLLRLEERAVGDAAARPTVEADRPGPSGAPSASLAHDRARSRRVVAKAKCSSTIARRSARSTRPRPSASPWSRSRNFTARLAMRGCLTDDDERAGAGSTGTRPHWSACSAPRPLPGP